jgi:hypothetical protein
MQQADIEASRISDVAAPLDAADEVYLADLDPVVTQDREGGCYVEVEIRDQKAEQILRAGEAHVVAGELLGHGAILGARELLCRQTFQEGDGFGETILQVRRGLVLVGKARDVHLCQARRAAPRCFRGAMDLRREGQHVDGQPTAQQDGRVHLLPLRIGHGLVEDGVEILQRADHAGNGGVIHGQGQGKSPNRATFVGARQNYPLSRGPTPRSQNRAQLSDLSTIRRSSDLARGAYYGDHHNMAIAIEMSSVG